MKRWNGWGDDKIQMGLPPKGLENNRFRSA